MDDGGLMRCNHLPSFLRTILWRLGRKTYTYARGDGVNDPRTNGEYWLLGHVLRATAGAKVLLDVGANRGEWTAQALQLADSSQALHPVRIHAFEPSRATRSMLLARFPEEARVTVQPYALSDDVGEARFYSTDDGGGTNSLSPVSGTKEERVQLTTIDHFIQQLGQEAVSMVKIDTEGFDLLVLKGAEEALARGAIEVVQFEYNWRWLLNHGALRDVFELIVNKPYRLGKLVGGSIEFHAAWHHELDRYFENNYVLIRKDSQLCTLGVPVQFDRVNALTIRKLRPSEK